MSIVQLFGKFATPAQTPQRRQISLWGMFLSRRAYFLRRIPLFNGNAPRGLPHVLFARPELNARRAFSRFIVSARHGHAYASMIRTGPIQSFTLRTKNTRKAENWAHRSQFEVYTKSLRAKCDRYPHSFSGSALDATAVGQQRRLFLHSRTSLPSREGTATPS